MKLLIIEDEVQLSQAMVSYLEGENYRCETARSFDEAMGKLELHQYDCVLIDLMLPGGDGLDLLRFYRKRVQSGGVIIISAKGEIDDKIHGLELGADDYLPKPFHLAELAARIHALIRRKQFNGSDSMHFNEMTLDLAGRALMIHDTPVGLTKREYDLLLFFLSNKNRVLSKASLAEHLSGDIADMFDNHDFVYAHVKNLKKKLRDHGCQDYLQTQYGTGYIWKG